MKVKIFDANVPNKLENKIDKFFEENHVITLDIKYSTCYEMPYIHYSVMIMYDEFE